MCRFLVRCAVLALGSMLSAAAPAAVATVDGTFRVEIGTIGISSITGSGEVDADGYWGASAGIPSGVFVSTGTTTSPLPFNSLNLGKVTVGPFQNLTGIVPGAMGNDGVANFFFTDGAAGGSVPLHYFGAGGTGMVVVGSLPMTVIGGVWTNLGVTSPTDVRTIMMIETAAGIPITVTASAFDRRFTPATTTHPHSLIGTVQLVAPVSVKLFGGVLGVMPSIGVLTLQFYRTPEPGALVLLSSGIVGLVAFGRTRPTASADIES